MALLPREGGAGTIAAAAYADIVGGFLLWPAGPKAERTAAARNAGDRGAGGEEPVFPHTAAVTCMCALHRETSNGRVAA